MAIVYNKLAPTDGLVLCLDSANRRSYPGAGTNWFDLSGNSNNGTLTNGVSYNGQAMSFDGVNDYIEPPSSQLNIINFTVFCWFYLTSTPVDYFPIISRYFNTSINNGWLLFVNNARQISLDGRENSTTYLTSNLSQSLPINNWYCATATKNGNLWSIYINGLLKNQLNNGVGTISFSTNRLTIGAGFYQWGNAYSPLLIDDVRIYNRALTNQEILTLYNVSRRRFL